MVKKTYFNSRNDWTTSHQNQTIIQIKYSHLNASNRWQHIN